MVQQRKPGRGSCLLDEQARRPVTCATALLRELALSGPRVAEKVFEAELWQELILGGQLPCKLAFRTESEDHLSGCAYPDICLVGVDAKTPIVAIECKADTYLHSLTTALGQCLLYKHHAPMAVVCVPSDESIPAVVRTIAAEQDIIIASGHNFGLFICEELERRGLVTLRILLKTGLFVPPAKTRVVIPMRAA